MAREQNLMTTTTTEDNQRRMMMSSSAVTSSSSSSSAAPTSTTSEKPNPRDFLAVKIIGEGSFSTVFKVRTVRNSTFPSGIYACKVCLKERIQREKKIDAIFRERNLMESLSQHRFPFFIRLYATFTDSSRLYFVLNYARNGELLNFMKPPGLSLICTTFYAAEILRALEHLHSLGIVHRDLKPENILLNKKMHIQVTDFGSAMTENDSLLKTTSSTITSTASSARVPSTQQQDGTSDSDNSALNGQTDDPNPFLRKGSFVGTAQYVSPEMLSHKKAGRPSDIWAFGCIVYQMMTGNFPFKAATDYLIFQKILRLDYVFPPTFDQVVKDFVESILKIQPEERLGVVNFAEGKYCDIRNHPMFKSFTDRWDSLHEEIPPLPPLPDFEDEDEEEELELLEPGFDERTIARLVLNEENRKERKISMKAIPDPSDVDFGVKLEKQRKENVYHQFVDGNLIIYQGLVDKWKRLLTRQTRMFLLTTGPHLYYIDPVNMVLKGEVPFSPEIRPEAKNFKTFYIHTPNRTYNCEDTSGDALGWCRRIEEVKHKYFASNKSNSATTSSSTSPATSHPLASSSVTSNRLISSPSRSDSR